MLKLGKMLFKVLFRRKMLLEDGIASSIECKIKSILIGIKSKNKYNLLLKPKVNITKNK